MVAAKTTTPNEKDWPAFGAWADRQPPIHGLDHQTVRERAWRAFKSGAEYARTSHECPEWDGLRIDSTMREWDACLCEIKKAA